MGKEVNDNLEVPVKEMMYIVLNTEKCYEVLSEMRKSFSEPLTDSAFYMLIVFTLLSEYRESLKVEIKNDLLMFYQALVEAIIKKDEEFLDKIAELMTKNEWKERSNK